jgi:hypothetical protein
MREFTHSSESAEKARRMKARLSQGDGAETAASAERPTRARKVVIDSSRRIGAREKVGPTRDECQVNMPANTTLYAAP